MAFLDDVYQVVVGPSFYEWYNWHGHSCAALADGNHACWGSDGNAQIGDGSDNTEEPWPKTFSNVP